MIFQHVNVKIFLTDDATFDPQQCIETFHRWIAQQSMQELLIDVADYRHVPMGPGIVLVGHEADYSLDNGGNRCGLRYNRKAPLEGSNQDRIGQALRSAGKACMLLESELDGLKFSRSEFEMFINDRALAPNTEETSAAFESELSEFLRSVVGQSEFQIDCSRDARCLVGGVVRLASEVSLASLAEV